MIKTAIIIWVIVLLIIVWLIVKKIKSNNIQAISGIVNQVYWTEKLLKTLWWKDISYPFIWFWWDLAEPVQILSLEEYQKDYLYWSPLLWWPKIWMWVEYIIDWVWKKYKVVRILMKDIWWVIDERVTDISFEKLENTNEILTFDELKNKIILWIKNTNDSVYAWLENELKITKNINELAWVMGKGAY